MEINLSVKTVKEVAAALGTRSHVLGISAWRYTGNRNKDKDALELRLDNMGLEDLKKLQTVMKANEEPSIRQVSKLINSLSDPSNKKVASLNAFPKALTEYLKGLDTFWLYSLTAGLKGVAYAVIDCEYHTPGYREHTSEPWVTLELGFNTKGAYKTWNIHISKSDVNNRSIPEILRDKELMVPSEDMVEDYETQLGRYQRYLPMEGEQFYARRTATQVSGSGWWWNSKAVEMTVKGKPSKVVIDMDSQKGYDRTRGEVRSAVVDKVIPVPTHPVLCVFSLAHHQNVWVHVSNLKRYKYEEGLRDRLVLPPSHVRLIGALVSNLDALRDEAEADDRSRTIRAKAQSSVILAWGPPGTGKTLTAEVYAEEIKRPLYEVNSGQLGTDPEEMEGSLAEVLARSIRLRMPLLINEADVFIQARGRDVVQNAIVSVFLRALEYHNGLVFLTTNRGSDVDDAIRSRCIAEIEYGVPEEDERARMWAVLASEFNIELSEKDCKRASMLFPKTVGRDIQNLLRLTNRVCKALGEEFTLKVMADNACFRSVEVDKARLAKWFPAEPEAAAE